MKIESPTTVITSSEEKGKSEKNDYSNPQQGSESMVSNAPSDDKSYLKTYSNNYQGKSGNRHNTLKNPPTKKDNRKLFVGGLPADSKLGCACFDRFRIIRL